MVTKWWLQFYETLKITDPTFDTSNLDSLEGENIYIYVYIDRRNTINKISPELILAHMKRRQKGIGEKKQEESRENGKLDSANPPNGGSLFTRSLVFIRFAIQSVESRGIFRSVSTPLSTSSIVAVPQRSRPLPSPCARERNIRFVSVPSPRGIELTIPSFISRSHAREIC